MPQQGQTYEAEQKELTEKVKANREMVNTYEQDKAGFDSFAAVIRKYVGITELSPRSSTSL